ncbi:hypothetical protein [Streptomyces sp. C36]|uniref:hypothetical protein n=1 Tax=Streptomyces sp. C36 TaxID=3237122 RepID=UPI0034C6CBA7
MVGGSEAHDIGPADHMSSGEARHFLSQLSGAFGVGGVLLVSKADAGGPEGGSLAPSDGLEWPRCECGSPRCPDGKAPAVRPTEELTAKVAEANRRSRRGGL